jgi:hypothetical protein
LSIARACAAGQFSPQFVKNSWKFVRAMAEQRASVGHDCRVWGISVFERGAGAKNISSWTTRCGRAEAPTFRRSKGRVDWLSLIYQRLAASPELHLIVDGFRSLKIPPLPSEEKEARQAEHETRALDPLLPAAIKGCSQDSAMKRTIITSALVCHFGTASSAAYACKDGGCCCDCGDKDHKASTGHLPEKGIALMHHAWAVPNQRGLD